MKKQARSIAHEFLAELQRSVVAAGSQPSKLTTDSSEFWFMKNGVSVRLERDEVIKYHSLVDTLRAELGEARWKVVSKRTIEELVQAAIAAVVHGPRTPKTVTTAVETLTKEIKAPAVPWEIWCGVTDMRPPRRLRRFGRVSFQATSERTMRALARRGKTLIDRSKNTRSQKASLKKLFATSLATSVHGEVIAAIKVNAVDKESAERLAIQEIRATLDAIGFFGSLLVPFAEIPSIDRGAERAGSALLSIKTQQFGSWPMPQGRKGPSIALDQLYQQPAVRDLRISLVSRLLAAQNPTPSQKRVLTALRWAGRAVGKARPPEQLLFYLIALECLLLPPETDSELTYRLRLRAAHLLARNVKEREYVFKKIGKLYRVRSAIVHTGSQEVSPEDLSSARRLTLNSVLLVLRRLSRVPDLEAWFVKQALQ
jgi:hypothetical protein